MEVLVTVSSKLAISMLQVVVQQLASPAMKEAGKIWNVDDEVVALLGTYEKIQARIDRWEGGGELNSTALETWLQQLEGYCYDAEDLVDYLCVICSIKNHSLRKQIIKSPFSRTKLTISRRIVKLRENLETLSCLIEEVLNARHNNNSNQLYPQSLSAAYCRSPLLDKTPLVFGASRDRDKESIIVELTSSELHPYGVSIIGMDGLGKSALARSIMVDSRIENHFPLVLSAHVSCDFQLEVIVEKLVAEYSRRTGSNQRDVDLQDLLNSHRSLIIFDDLWSVREDDWFTFKCNYLSSTPGWKILTTTRDPKVAEITKSVAHFMDTMTDEECNEVITQRAGLCESDREIWKDDVKLIAKKCKGMPVIAHKLGLIMSTKGDRDALRDTIQQFKNNDLWELLEFRQIFPSLKLNEPKLPPDLKRCFAYCSLFSSGHTFSKEELIQLWEVEGFVRPRQRKDSQPTGNECFDQLLSRSIFKPLKSSKDKQTMYVMHELNHEFAQHLASEAFRRIDEGTTKLPSSYEKSLRHLSLICETTDDPLLKSLKKCRGLRTFLLLHQNGPKRRTISDYSFFRKLESLRLLDLSHTNVSKLIDLVSPLSHLRYLDLSKTDIQTLPEPIHPLGALQVLKLDGCFKLDLLPKDLNQLFSLRHLHVNMKRLARLPSKLGTLTRLEILSSFIVGSTEGNKITELKNMEHLTEICISRLENISNKEEAEESKLSTKLQLKRLVLEWDNPTAEMANASDILEGLKPHDDLKELILRNYRCQKFPTWLSSPSLKLVSIYLQNCPDCQVLPLLGQLHFLKTLVLYSINKVEKVDGQFCGQDEPGFRQLETLEFREMGSLVSWIGLRASDMPCLCTLKIIGCQNLTSLPTLIHQRFLVYLEISNCLALESLPEIPLSMNGEGGKLIIVASPLVEERCQPGGADWPKIKDMACYKENFQTITTTSSSVQPSWINKVLLTMKQCVSMLKRHNKESNKGDYFYKPYWVLILAVMLVPILLSVVLY